MARFAPGDLVYHDYGLGVIHERVVLAHVDGLDYVIATPDRDVYTETLDLDPSNGDLAGFHVGLPGGVLPAAIAGGNVYGFGALTAAEYRGLLEQGRTEATAEKARRGLGAMVADAAPAAAGERKWVLAEMVSGHKIGEEVQMAAGSSTDGDWGLHHMVDSDGQNRVVLVSLVKKDELDTFCDERILLCREAEAVSGEELISAEDDKTLSIRYGINGERSRGFKESVQEMRVSDFSDFPFNPRTCHDYMKAVSSVAESCLSQHNMWLTQSGIPAGDRSQFEDDCLARVIDYAVKYMMDSMSSTWHPLS